MAELYQMYFNTQRGKINRRTPITGYVPRNMAEWTGNIYREKIFQHALDAVKAQPQTLRGKLPLVQRNSRTWEKLTGTSSDDVRFSRVSQY